MGRADTHCHTTASDGIHSPGELIRFALAARLSVVAITDHNTIAGALEAQDVAGREGLPIEVVVGQEISTRSGDILGLFIKSPIKPGLSLEDAIHAVHDDQGIVVIAHPFLPHPGSISRRRLESCMEAGAIPDALEAHNPTPGARLVRREICRRAVQWGLAVTGGSDCHRLDHLGQAWTEFPGSSPSELRVSIQNRTAVAFGADRPLIGIIPLVVQLPNYRRGRYFRQADRRWIDW